MKILIDMNLSPEWVPVFEKAGHPAVHWSAVGAPDAPDTEIMIWARLHEHIVFTHDLDYGAILHATGATAPSVIQVRTEDVRPEKAADLILRALKTAAPDLLSGALITVDPRKTRLSVLPLRKRS